VNGAVKMREAMKSTEKKLYDFYGYCRRFTFSFVSALSKSRIVKYITMNNKMKIMTLMGVETGKTKKNR
jgi:hypothetical protein